MKVENVAKSAKRADKFVVSFDSGDEITVSAAHIADFGLYSGREFSEDEYSELISTIEMSASKARAIRILGSRSLSAKEVERRLESKGESAETAGATVEWLKENGLINDTEYAASIVSHYLAKGYGPARVKDELYRRGIPRETSEAALSGLDLSGSENAAYDYIEKKLRGSTDKDDLRKVTNALYRRGFNYDDARAAVRKYVENIGDKCDIDGFEYAE